MYLITAGTFSYSIVSSYDVLVVVVIKDMKYDNIKYNVTEEE